MNGCEHDTTVTLIEPGKLGIDVDKVIIVDQDQTVFLDTMLNLITGVLQPIEIPFGGI